MSGTYTSKEEYFFIYSSNKILIVHQGEIIDKHGFDESNFSSILRLNVIESF